MRTYLLTWNPAKWTWADLQAKARQTEDGGTAIEDWSCGVTKRIVPGDAVYLIRLGKRPRGIVASGWVERGSFTREHWDRDKAARGDTTLYVDCRFEVLFEEPALPQDVLKRELPRVGWSPQASGTEIREPHATALESLWAAAAGHRTLDRTDPELSALEGEVVFRLVRHRRREQSLRDEKLAIVRRENAGRLPCGVCGFDYSERYGALGSGYAQVHHLARLSDRSAPTRTSLADLIVVCASCHAIIHRGGACREPEEVRTALHRGPPLDQNLT